MRFILTFQLSNSVTSVKGTTHQIKILFKYTPVVRLIPPTPIVFRNTEVEKFQKVRLVKLLKYTVYIFLSGFIRLNSVDHKLSDMKILQHLIISG